MLPTVKNSSEIYGETQMGLTMGEDKGTTIKISGIAGDQQAATIWASMF